jgi:hypothetical protein
VKNHFVPQFALEYWAEGDGKVPYFSRHRGRVNCGRLAPKFTGYDDDLYAFRHVAAERRHAVEQRFFSPLDSAAAPIYARLERREQFEFGEEERRVWAMFLVAGIARVPEKIEKARRIGARHLVSALEEDPEEYLSVKGNEPEATFLDWVKNNQPGMLENVGLSHLTQFLADRKNVQPYMDLDWTVHSVAHADVELLLGDRPVWTHKRPSDPDFMAVMPLSPRSLFVAANSKPLVQRLIDAGPSSLVRLANETIVQHAQLRIYGRAEVSFIDRCLREPPGAFEAAVEAAGKARPSPPSMSR